jgi:starch synthase (maltosyl-transferring)
MSAGEDSMDMNAGRSRVMIEAVAPQIDGGMFAVKRIVGDRVTVTADVFGDGHDAVRAVLWYGPRGATPAEVPLAPLGNDRWQASFAVDQLGRWEFSVAAWVDRFGTWTRDLERRQAAGALAPVDLQIGAALVSAAAQRAAGVAGEVLREHAAALQHAAADAVERALGAELADLMARYDAREFVSQSAQYPVEVGRERARFGAWYELFPRSCATQPGAHGTLRDVMRLLPDIAAMGFDIVYLPPIHPIGTTFRKGRNNAVQAAPDDVGSPWGIGSAAGGHRAVHPQLGTLDDVRALVHATAAHGLELAMDIALQCSPDHPYVREHPQWFRARPDGTIQYAENPPKKYQDIYPFDFECDDWRALWAELTDIFRFWCQIGVRVFRVDNPHTKPYHFWQYAIETIVREFPGTMFLSEAFTRPKVMYRLAKLGFTQSYNYFPWRNTRAELTEFMLELTSEPVRDFFGANLWPNTPDILPFFLQHGGRPAFVSRFVLAATLGPAYGIYGPAFELGENLPLAPGREEYLSSEKYEIRQWDRDRADSLRPLITTVNRARRAHPALQHTLNLRFHAVDNDQIIAYSKTGADGRDRMLIVVNLDPHHRQSGFVDVALDALALDASQPYEVHDLLTDARYRWYGARNFVILDPAGAQAHVFVVNQPLPVD